MRLPRALFVVVLMMAACSARDPEAADSKAAADAPAWRGWYGRGHFQPCGEPSLEVHDPGALDAALTEAGLAGGEPVYVRLQGRAEAGGIRVVRILALGSATPVRDCPMTGTSTP